ncbi:hypothetical protein JCM15765_42410 [Paradesulfitobacterium aromaticivorans]
MSQLKWLDVVALIMYENDLVITVEHLARKAIRLHVFLAPKPIEVLTPHVHAQEKWVKISELGQLPLAPADIEVAQTLLVRWSERNVLS